MNAKQAFLKTNGDGKVDWTAYLRLWPMVLAALVFAYVLGERLESDDERMARLDLCLAPMKLQLNYIEMSLMELRKDLRSHRDNHNSGPSSMIGPEERAARESAASRFVVPPTPQ